LIFKRAKVRLFIRYISVPLSRKRNQNHSSRTNLTEVLFLT
jgi:hypothetical protein